MRHLLLRPDDTKRSQAYLGLRYCKQKVLFYQPLQIFLRNLGDTRQSTL